MATRTRKNYYFDVECYNNIDITNLYNNNNNSTVSDITDDISDTINNIKNITCLDYGIRSNAEIAEIDSFIQNYIEYQCDADQRIGYIIASTHIILGFFIIEHNCLSKFDCILT